MIRIIHCQIGKEPEIKMIEDNLPTFQELVRSGAKYGLIENVYFDNDYILVCHEEGQILNLPKIAYISTPEGFPVCPISGEFFITRKGYNEESGLFYDSLDEEEAERLLRWIKVAWCWRKENGYASY